MPRTYYEFFAGGGMVRAGLGPRWRCVFANDFDHKKSRSYKANWGENELLTADVRSLGISDLPGRADLAWASFPCQDLSLAGGGAGLRGDRSGTFWPFWELMKSLVHDDRAPRMIALENVCGTLTSHDGKDFAAICSALKSAGYHYGALVIDASLFLPQSRPRLFIVCVRDRLAVPAECLSAAPVTVWHKRVVEAFQQLPTEAKQNWLWWNMPLPAARSRNFADLIEADPEGVAWFSKERTDEILALMSPINLAKIEKAKMMGRRMVGGLYRRTRADEHGHKVQRAEIRFDDVSGCLRTPAGGSSRQVIVIVEAGKVLARLISARETARLMGLPDSYILPENYNEAYHLTGDGVVVPVVRHLAQHIFEPILQCLNRKATAAA
ncbi:MAG: DNA cytosine methyltransferase [Acidobacteria bacterium]|nr:DNA cytosine methyltransferase [Acidobacteriota bacterium]